MDENAVTLRSYEHHIAEFVAGTPKDMIGGTKAWIDSLLAMLPRSARILELGSGFGRDAAYIRDKGYTVECTDGAQGFVDLLNAQGQPARMLNIVSDELGGQYDLVFANAVFEHLPAADLRHVLSKVHHALALAGLLGFSVREGTGEQWSNDKLGAPRYFCNWEPDSLLACLEEACFELMSIESSRGFQDIRRLYVIAGRRDVPKLLRHPFQRANRRGSEGTLSTWQPTAPFPKPRSKPNYARSSVSVITSPNGSRMLTMTCRRVPSSSRACLKLLENPRSCTGAATKTSAASAERRQGRHPKQDDGPTLSP